MRGAAPGLSPYERRARLTPGLLVMLPIALLVLVLGFKTNLLVSGVATILVAGGGAFLLSTVVGNVGRGAEPGLHRSWGGRPSTQLLRLRAESSNSAQRDVWRAALSAVTGSDLFSKRRELANPDGADHAIEAASDQMRGLTHDKRHPAVGIENAAYGFERNTFALRWIGRATSGTCLLVIAAMYVFAREAAHLTAGVALVGIAAEVILLIVWFILPSSERARMAGFRYANQMFNAIVAENRATKKQSPSGSDEQP